MPENAKVIGEIAMIYEQSRAPLKYHAPNLVRQKKHAHGQKSTSDHPQPKSYVQSEHRMSDAERLPLRTSGLCFSCKQPGHTSIFCTKRKGGREESLAVRLGKDEFEIPDRLDKLCGTCQEKEFHEEVYITVDGHIVKALWDSGCTGIIVSSKLVPKEKNSSQKREAVLADKGVRKVCHTAVVHIDSPYFIANTDVTILEDPLYSVLIGKWYGVGKAKKHTPLYPIRDPTWYQEEAVAAVSTRGQQKEEEKMRQTPVARTGTCINQTSDIYIPEDLRSAQKEDNHLIGFNRWQSLVKRTTE